MFNVGGRLWLGCFLWVQLICSSAQGTISKDYTPEEIYKAANHAGVGSEQVLGDWIGLLETALGIRFEQRESETEGGVYYVHRPGTGLRFAVYSNFNESEDHYNLDAHRNLKTILYLEGGSPIEQFDALVKLEGGIHGLTFFLPEKPKPKNLINVIDLESTCWRKEEAAGKISEIIEIGISVVDRDSLELLSTESIIIQPAVSEVSEFCTGLTTLTPAFVAENGIPFVEAARILEEKYASKTRLFASYGDYDRKMFEGQFARLGVASVIGPEHLNVKREFAELHGLKRQVGMAQALNRIRLPLEGKHHRGGDDSRNIAKILIHLLGATRSEE
jgi:hypothetical protein